MLVEIGVWHGVTTCRLRAVMAPQGVLLAIDPFPPGRLGFSMQRRIAHSEVRRIPNGSVRWIRKTGAEAGAEYAAGGNPPVDFVFIDGDHSYDGVQGDWNAWSSMLAPGGTIALHDSRSSTERKIDDTGTALFTRTVVVNDQRFDTLEYVDTLTVLRRR